METDTKALKTKINTITKKEKLKIVRGRPGKKKGFKKALVTLKKGQSIDLSLGVGKSKVWTCDLTKKYIDINADYRS